MGMYNEVSCNCPNCGSNVIIQVTQYVLGFGCFDLNNLESFLELNEEQLNFIREELKEKHYCNQCKCEFYPLNEDEKEEKIRRIKQILFKE